MRTRKETISLLCGVDEAGRGPLAGSVFAAAVILDPERPVEGLNDSKLLPEEVREELALLIKDRARCWAIASASVEEIERMNILRASLYAMRRAILALSCRPMEVCVDGLHKPPIRIKCRPVVKADRTVPEVSAASILAKTARDAEMREMDTRFPGYGFANHKGYSTPEHMLALKALGPCAIHRRSFEPVRLLLQVDLPF
ncbi:Ribonuclease HII [Usitatibacter rugosus]|uniref:Ribonuclease HII n=1 Tax=Usitatibacter rugosus TaxID=2732067 RepID=A0A6M4GUI5_9PROT|nr:ribonuclease HII [Usitatibacter rugosus]QJR09993.1 Ribonuclease HII [Usitatibacter rugosus]